MRCLGEKEAQVSLLKVENWYSAIGTGLKGEVSGSRWKTFERQGKEYGPYPTGGGEPFNILQQ